MARAVSGLEEVPFAADDTRCRSRTATPARSTAALSPAERKAPRTNKIVHGGTATSTSNNILGRASELAFDFLFSLFPLILFMVTLFGLFASHSVELQNDLLSYFGDFLPPDAFHLLRTTAIELAAMPATECSLLGLLSLSGLLPVA